MPAANPDKKGRESNSQNSGSKGEDVWEGMNEHRTLRCANKLEEAENGMARLEHKVDSLDSALDQFLSTRALAGEEPQAGSGRPHHSNVGTNRRHGVKASRTYRGA